MNVIKVLKAAQYILQKAQALCLTLALLLVRAYQLFLSPLLPSACRFYPSCSNYCQQALIEHGLFKGLALSTGRICRCHPGHPGGIDLVPEKNSEVC